MGSKKTYIAGLDGYDLLSLEDVSTQTALELNKYNSIFLEKINNFLIKNKKEQFKIITPTIFNK